MNKADSKITQLSKWLHQRGIFTQIGVMGLLGALASLSLPPLFLAPAVLAFIPFFIHASSCKSTWQAILIFWGFAFGWFTASLYWISASLFVDISWEVLILPLSLFALPAFLSVFWGLAGLLVCKIGRTAEARLLYSALFIGLAELLRSVLFTGFPWNSPSHLILTHDNLSQIASLIGQNGSVFLVLISIVGGCFLYLRFWKMGVLCFLPLLASIVYGGWRLDSSSVLVNAEFVQNPEILVRMVQPNVPQKERWKPEFKNEQIDELFALSVLNKELPSLIIWPEAAYPSIWPNSKAQFTSLASSVLPENIQLLSGMLRFDEENKLYNSALLFNADGQLTGKIDKQKRVPFGEYIPFRNSLIFQNLNLFGNKIDISAGPNLGLLSTQDNIKLKIFICYEIIFPNLVSLQGRPDIIINLTNDAWFGNTLGPYQHLSQARLKAIEEGVPLVRVANTGISAAFNYQGLLLGKIDLMEQGVLDVLVSLQQQNTIYSQYRWKIIFFIISIFIVCSVLLDVNFLTRQKAKKTN